MHKACLWGLLVHLLLFQTFLFAQTPGTTCATAIQVCPNVPTTYPANTDGQPAETGPNYGCLSSRPNPSWFYFQVNTPGIHNILISNSLNSDLDFIVYGPFASLSGTCSNLTAGNTVDCSYAGGASETVNFTSVASGDYYILLITNFSNDPTSVSFVQTSGTGNFNCSFEPTCIIPQVAVNPGYCNTQTNLYSLIGTVFVLSPPASGNLVISLSGQTIQLQPPFANNIPFTLQNLPSTGQEENLTAFFSETPACSLSVAVNAPEPCLECSGTLSSNAPLCEGGSLALSSTFDAGSTFTWTGPNGFISNEVNPVLENISFAQAGIYTLAVTGSNCAANVSIEVEVIESPKPEITGVNTPLCEGEILFLGAIDHSGASWQWQGPNGFSAPSRNAQILECVPGNAGAYVLWLSYNNCEPRSDTVLVEVNPSPVLVLSAENNYQPGEVAVVSATQIEGGTYFWNFLQGAGLIENELYSADRDSVVLFLNDSLEGTIVIRVIAEDANGCRSEAANVQFTVDSSVGGTSLSGPGPTFPVIDAGSRQLQIKGLREACDYRIHELSGRLIQQGRMQPGSWVHLEPVARGVYIVQWLEGSKPQARKIALE